ncbi:actin-like protein 6B isoform X1 [Neodiprion pinetum]|uniref:actin-like protein 6B isoform X1 n=1 Tax=Neodiprion pinetum TaxID=441929 RepID=UPI001EDCDECC|nr:actin-like protein 6B isoform X1 [Neodiprion pinetum]
MSGGVYGGDEVGAIIFDIGHQSLRVGYGGEDSPKAEVPTSLGVWEDAADQQQDNQTNKKRFNIDTTAIQVRKKDMEIVSLMKDGMIEDWDMFEKLAEYTYKNRLHAVAEHHPILMTECPWNTRFKREKLLELMFEKFNVPAMYICKNAVLAAYANGRSTAMVVDSGATHTSAVPVHDGYVITQGIVKSPLGGDFITMQCKQFLEDKDIDLTPAYLVASKDVVREQDPPRWTRRPGPEPTTSWLNHMVRELLQDFQTNTLQISDGPYDEDIANSLPMKRYEFPTGYNDDFGSARLMIPEALFDPSNVKGVGASILGVGPLVTTSVGMCDMDIRPSLYGSVVVTGGNSCLSGFSDRLNRDLVSKTPPSMRLKIICANSSSERRYGAWIGGSILSSLGSFQQMWLSRQEYEESGKLILDRCS